LRPGKKLHTPVGVPPSGLLTMSSPGNHKENGEGRRRGKQEGGREKEREREKREGSGVYG
jgi:hypothetical protein